MYKVRIDEPGWDSYSDYLGAVKFENGVSERELTEREVIMIGANVKIVRIDNDEQVGLTVIMANTDHLSAEVTPPLQRADQEEAVELLYDALPPEEVNDLYTEEQLLEIAEKGGMKAIRKIGDEFGVKGVQINGLIKEILEAQSKGE